MTNVGIIGRSGHAQRLIACLPQDVTRITYHPDGKQASTDDMTCLTECDAIIIASPTDTHGRYMRLLRHELGYNRYIMCEKPPFMSREDHNEFLIPDGKTYFNFNFRFGFYSDLFNLIHKYRLGDLQYVNVDVSHRLAYAEKYKNMWRSDVSRHQLGVIETVAVHWFDLFNLKLGQGTCVRATLENYAGTGTAPDSGFVTFTHGSVTTNIFTSYASGPRLTLTFACTSGTISVVAYSSTGEIKVHLGDQLVHEERYSQDTEYIQTLKHSMDHFLEAVNGDLRFCNEDYNSAMVSNSVLLDLMEQFSRK